jgi:hypothetical protein
MPSERHRSFGSRAGRAAILAAATACVPACPPARAASTPTLLTGTFTFVSKITLVSISSKIQIVGYVSAGVLDSSGVSHSTYASFFATRKGDTATLSISIPYSWIVAAGPLTVGVSIGAQTGVGNGESFLNTTTVGATIATPANGATTTVNLPLKL